MKHWTIRRIAICLLGMLLSLGMGLSAVQAGGMTVKMAVAGDMGASGGDGCTGCGDDDAGKAATCLSVCSSPVFTMPAGSGIVSRMEPVASPLCDARPLRSIAFSPDPHPPRPDFVV